MCETFGGFSHQSKPMRLWMFARSPRAKRSQRSNRACGSGWPISCSIREALTDDLSNQLIGALHVIHADRDAGVVAIVKLRQIAMQMLL